MTMNSSGAILDCGGKRSATPLSDRTNSGVALHLPPQSKGVHWQSLIGFRDRRKFLGLRRTSATARFLMLKF